MIRKWALGKETQSNRRGKRGFHPLKQSAGWQERALPWKSEFAFSGAFVKIPFSTETIRVCRLPRDFLGVICGLRHAGRLRGYVLKTGVGEAGANLRVDVTKL